MKTVRDTIKESNEACAAANNFDVKAQFAIPDIAEQLRAAYYHGYRDALLKQSAHNQEGKAE